MNCDDKQLKFSVFVINQISQAVKKPTADVYKYLTESGVLDEYIIGCYDTLHTLFLNLPQTGAMVCTGLIYRAVYQWATISNTLSVWRRRR